MGGGLSPDLLVLEQQKWLSVISLGFVLVLCHKSQVVLVHYVVQRSLSYR